MHANSGHQGVPSDLPAHFSWQWRLGLSSHSLPFIAFIWQLMCWLGPPSVMLLFRSLWPLKSRRILSVVQIVQMSVVHLNHDRNTSDAFVESWNSGCEASVCSRHFFGLWHSVCSGVTNAVVCNYDGRAFPKVSVSVWKWQPTFALSECVSQYL